MAHNTLEIKSFTTGTIRTAFQQPMRSSVNRILQHTRIEPITAKLPGARQHAPPGRQLAKRRL